MSLSYYASLIRTHFPQLSFNECTPINEGWDSFVLDIENVYVFRFARRMDVEAQFQKEALLLPELTKRLKIRVPVPEFLKLSPPPPLIMGYRKIPGEKLLADMINEGNSEHYISQLADLIKGLNSLSTDCANRLNIPILNGRDWRNWYLSLFKEIKVKVFGRLSERCQTEATNLFEDYLEKPRNFLFTPSLIHRDLTSDHILHDPEGQTITGVIDWGDSSFGDPAFDYTGLLYDYGTAFAESVINSVGHPSDYIERVRFYSKIIPFHGVLYGIETGRVDYIEDNLAKIETIFSE